MDGVCISIDTRLSPMISREFAKIDATLRTDISMKSATIIVLSIRQHGV